MCSLIYIDFKITWKENFSTKNIIFTTVKALILRKFDKFRGIQNRIYSDPVRIPEPDPNEHENQDLDPNKVGSDPQHCCWQYSTPPPSLPVNSSSPTTRTVIPLESPDPSQHIIFPLPLRSTQQSTYGSHDSSAPYGTYLLILFLCAEVALDNIKGFLIDLHVLVGLEELDLVEAEDLLYDDGVGVRASRLLRLLLAQPQDVLQTVQRNLVTAR